MESDWFLSNIYCTVTLYHLTDTVTLRQCRIVKLFFDAMHASLSLSLFIPFSVTLYTVTVTDTVTLRQCRTVKLFFDAMKASLSLSLSISFCTSLSLFSPLLHLGTKRILKKEENKKMEHSKSKAVASNLRQERSCKFERSVSASNVYFFRKKQNHLR